MNTYLYYILIEDNEADKKEIISRYATDTLLFGKRIGLFFKNI